MSATRKKARGAKKVPKRTREMFTAWLKGAPVQMTLFGIPVVASPHIRPGVLLVDTETFHVLKIALDVPLSPRRKAGGRNG